MTLRAGDLIEIGRCTVELERHLVTAHRAAGAEAEHLAERWALVRLRDTCR